MQNELISMILGSLAAAASVAWPRRAFIFGVLSLSQGMFLGTVGVGGVGFIGCLFVADFMGTTNHTHSEKEGPRQGTRASSRVRGGGGGGAGRRPWNSRPRARVI